MTKQLLSTKTDWYRLNQEEWEGLSFCKTTEERKSWYHAMKFDEPERFPCVVVYKPHPEVEGYITSYIYLTDFVPSEDEKITQIKSIIAKECPEDAEVIHPVDAVIQIQELLSE